MPDDPQALGANAFLSRLVLYLLLQTLLPLHRQFKHWSRLIDPSDKTVSGCDVWSAIALYRSVWLYSCGTTVSGTTDCCSIPGNGLRFLSIQNTYIVFVQDGGSTKPDLMFVAMDCFHFSRIAHVASAAHLWNNMVSQNAIFAWSFSWFTETCHFQLQPLGTKSHTLDPNSVNLQCPDPVWS